MEELKRLFNEYERATKRADITDIIWSGDPENIEKEADFDKAYSEQFNIFSKLASHISEYAGIDEKTARAMINGKHGELKDLIRRIA